MLLIIYQIFSSLLGHIPFSVHFLLHFYGATFFGTPNIYTMSWGVHCSPKPPWKKRSTMAGSATSGREKVKWGPESIEEWRSNKGVTKASSKIFALGHTIAIFSFLPCCCCCCYCFSCCCCCCRDVNGRTKPFMDLEKLGKREEEDSNWSNGRRKGNEGERNFRQTREKNVSLEFLA